MTGGELVMAYKMQRDEKGYYMNIEDIPEEALMECVRIRDIVKARILTRREKQQLNRGSGDVLCTSKGGLQYFITREQVTEEYRYLDSKKVKLFNWEAGKEVELYRNDSTMAYAILLPKGVRALCGGKEIPSGYYVVCYATQEGIANRTKIDVVNPSDFRKMFVMRPNEIINRNKGTGAELYSLKDENRRKNQKQITFNDNSSNLDTSTDTKTKAEFTPMKIGNMSERLDKEPEKKPAANKIKAVGRITDDRDKLIGFVIENAVGRRAQISVIDMVKAAKDDIVSNICVVNKDGSQFLRGIDIKIGELPKM